MSPPDTPRARSITGVSVPEVREILAARAGEAMSLNDAHLNPQLGRIVRTLGFDRPWGRGEGPYLVRAQGGRWLALSAGTGVFAAGRTPPEVVRALHDPRDASLPNLPQLGVSLL